VTQELNQTTGHWQVSAQGHGEVLVVRVELEGAVLVWAGPHQDADAESVGVILRAAAVFAREATRRERRSLPIPAMLYHLMSRLIAGDVPRRWPASCVAVMLDSPRELGFGLLGEAEQQAWAGGSPVQLPWVRLVQRGGGDARAYRLAPDQDAKVRWSWSRKDVEGHGAVIEAIRPTDTAIEISDSPATQMSDSPTTVAPAWVDATTPRAPVAAAEPVTATPVPDAAPAHDAAPAFDASPAFDVAPASAAAPAFDGTPAFDTTPSFAEAAPAEPPVFPDRRAEPLITPHFMQPEDAPVAESRPSPPVVSTPTPTPTPLAPPPPVRRMRLQPPPPALAPVKGSRFFGWLDRVIGGADRDELPEYIPPTPEPEAVTSRALHLTSPEPGPPAPRIVDVDTQPAVAAASVKVIPITAPAMPSLRDTSAVLERTGTGGEVDVTPDPDELPKPRRARPMPPLRPRYEEEDEEETPAWRKPWVIAAGILVLIVAGFVTMQFFGRRSGGMFSGGTFSLAVSSEPAGAGIVVDGKETTKITPTTLALAPGKHQVALTLPGRGSANYDVEAKAGQKATLEAPLNGSLNIEAADAKVPVSIAVDGVDRGYAPLTIDKLAPGPHEVRFAVPGSAPWSESFELSIGQTYQMVARSMAEPGTGIVAVRGVVIGGGGEDDATGAEVWVDGERRGVAPLTLELASGPHSFRSRYQGEEAPVQVVDLPGGNQRFVQFRFGLGIEMPRLGNVSAPGSLPLDRPAVVSCYLTGVQETDLAEMWLHVRAPNGNWRRYEMVPLKAPGGIVGTAVFPAVMLEASGQAPHYMSAVSRVGDEYFTEIFWMKQRRRAAPAASASGE